MILVLVTTGKGEDVDTAKIMTFADDVVALNYCFANSDITAKKYWKNAVIIEEGVEYEISQQKTVPA